MVIVTKHINGNDYLYEQHSHRDKNGKVYVEAKYLGPAKGGGSVKNKGVAKFVDYTGENLNEDLKKIAEYVKSQSKKGFEVWNTFNSVGDNDGGINTFITVPKGTSEKEVEKRLLNSKIISKEDYELSEGLAKTTAKDWEDAIKDNSKQAVADELKAVGEGLEKDRQREEMEKYLDGGNSFKVADKKTVDKYLKNIDTGWKKDYNMFGMNPPDKGEIKEVDGKKYYVSAYKSDDGKTYEVVLGRFNSDGTDTNIRNRRNVKSEDLGSVMQKYREIVNNKEFYRSAKMTEQAKRNAQSSFNRSKEDYYKRKVEKEKEIKELNILSRSKYKKSYNKLNEDERERIREDLSDKRVNDQLMARDLEKERKNEKYDKALGSKKFLAVNENTNDTYEINSSSQQEAEKFARKEYGITKKNGHVAHWSDEENGYTMGD